MISLNYFINLKQKLLPSEVEWMGDLKAHRDNLESMQKSSLAGDL